MKTLVKFIVALLLGLLPYLSSIGQSTHAVVKVTNLENVNGNLYIGWYNLPTDFRINDKAIYREKVNVNNQSEIEVEFAHIPTGKYAIAVFLDENDNYELDRNFFGLPTEKYGFSNNVLPSFRPATFEESSFNLNHPETVVSINLNDQ